MWRWKLKKKKVRSWEDEKVGKFDDGMLRLQIAEFGLWIEGAWGLGHGAKSMAHGAIFEVGSRNAEVGKRHSAEGKEHGVNVWTV